MALNKTKLKNKKRSKWRAHFQPYAVGGKIGDRQSRRIRRGGRRRRRRRGERKEEEEEEEEEEKVGNLCNPWSLIQHHSLLDSV